MKRIWVLFAVVMSAALLLSGCKKDNSRLIKVESAIGKTAIERGSDTLNASAGMKLNSGDTANVTADSSLLLLIDGDKHVYARENTVFTVTAPEDEPNGKVTIQLLDGYTLCTVDNELSEDSPFTVKTPNAVFSTVGNTFRVRYYPGDVLTQIEVVSGTVHAESSDGTFYEDIEAGSTREIWNGSIYEIINIDASYEGPSGSETVPETEAPAETSVPTEATEETTVTETATAVTSEETVTEPTEESTSQTTEKTSAATTTAKPAVTTTQPPVTTTVPVTTTQPPVTTTVPVTTTQPPVTTTVPVTTTQPPVTTTVPVTTTKPPVTTTVPVTTTKPPVTTTVPVTTKPSVIITTKPVTTTRPPVTTKKPATTTKPATTQPPANPNNSMMTGTQPPAVTTQASEVTQVPEVTQAPEETQVPEGTQAPPATEPPDTGAGESAAQPSAPSTGAFIEVEISVE